MDVAQSDIIESVKASVAYLLNQTHALCSRALRASQCGILALPCHELMRDEDVAFAVIYIRVIKYRLYGIFVGVIFASG